MPGLRAARDGAGLAHLPVYVAQPYIGDGSLVPALTSYMVPLDRWRGVAEQSPALAQDPGLRGLRDRQYRNAGRGLRTGSLLNRRCLTPASHFYNHPVGNKKWTADGP
jgi:DNA-binding transcriptional LysR family regulator